MFRVPLLPGLLWAALIALITLIPGNYIPRVSSFLDWLGPDKFVHLLLFGPLAYLLLAGFKRQRSSLFLKKYTVITVFASGIVFALFTEGMQLYVIPGRNGNIYDLLADTLGLALGYLAWHYTGRNEKKNLRSSKKYN